LSANIDLDVQVHCSPWTAHIDPTQLQQVLVNLAVNARDAMPEGGTLTIRAMKHPRGSASLPPECANGDWLNIDVEDDGCGIPEEISGKIFEPFFSTKDAGTGLGLATSYGIVEQSGGHLKCTSILGQGAKFSIWLPRSTAPDLTATEDPSKPHRLANATILVVEDQLPVLEVVRRTLTRVGFEVTACRRPQEALEVLEQRGTRFDLLLSDVVMPEMSGPQLASIVRERTPGTLVLFMSGYSGEHLMRELNALDDVGFLKKPFRPHDLVDKINAILEAPSLRHE
jgi:two-component system cell cycle sensor histidine kinase/response regulator CckA